MGLRQDIIEASERVDIDPYTQAFKPSDLGLKASDYGSFADYCAKDDAVSGHWSDKVVLRVAERTEGGKPHKYLLINRV